MSLTQPKFGNAIFQVLISFTGLGLISQLGLLFLLYFFSKNITTRARPDSLSYEHCVLIGRISQVQKTFQLLSAHV